MCRSWLGKRCLSGLIVTLELNSGQPLWLTTQTPPPDWVCYTAQLHDPPPQGDGDMFGWMAIGLVAFISVGVFPVPVQVPTNRVGQSQ